MTALMTNQEKYRKGEVAGITVEFPTTKEAMQEALKAIGVDGIRCREVFLTEHDSNLSGFCHCINQSDPVDELNYLCRLLSDMTDTELATFQAVVEYIPPEHRVFEYPKLNIRERMAAYSELSGRASQRSKPAPEPGRDDR